MASLEVYVAEYPGFDRAREILEALPQNSREKLKKKLDRPDIFLGELLKLKIAAEIGEDVSAIEKGRLGKPYFAGRDDIAFNISHSGKLAVGALLRLSGGEVAGGAEIGVDIERIDRENVARMEKISGRFFTEGERAVIAAADDAAAEFYLTWTRKEAYLKYTGEGISRPLGEVDTSAERTTRTVSRILRGSDGGEYAFSVCLPAFLKDEADDAENIKFTNIF